MRGQPNKYHVTDNGNIYRVNEDGSFTDMGNVETKSSATLPSHLASLEQIVAQGNMRRLNRQDIIVLAKYSQNAEVLLEISEYDDGDIFSLLVKRFEDGATFLEDAVLNGGQWDKSDNVRLAMARCQRKFADDSILQDLAKDKNPQVKQAALSNPHLVTKSRGCLTILLLPFIIGFLLTFIF